MSGSLTTRIDAPPEDFLRVARAAASPTGLAVLQVDDTDAPVGLLRALAVKFGLRPDASRERVAPVRYGDVTGEEVERRGSAAGLGACTAATLTFTASNPPSRATCTAGSMTASPPHQARRPQPLSRSHPHRTTAANCASRSTTT